VAEWCKLCLGNLRDLVVTLWCCTYYVLVGYSKALELKALSVCITYKVLFISVSSDAYVIFEFHCNRAQIYNCIS
jgi:hypothetical protein